jgi:Restriction endonuclease
VFDAGETGVNSRAYASRVTVKLDLTPEDYEDGVAELLAEKFADGGTVERDARLPSKSGGRDRQIDVLVRIPLADIGEELMVVDCKRYGTKVDVKDVEAFIGMVEDVGAAIGMLVTTEGYTAKLKLVRSLRAASTWKWCESRICRAGLPR